MTGDQTSKSPWYPLIVNQEAGQADQVAALLEAARSLSRETGCRIEPLEIDPADLKSVLKEQVEKQPQAILVAGGDGTLHTAANILVGQKIPFGPLPFGTFNLFTQELGLSLDPGEALAQLVHGQSRQADVGQINGRIFIHNASIGIHPHFILQREAFRETFRLPKKQASLVSWAWSILRPRLSHITLESEAGRQEFRTPFLFMTFGDLTPEPLVLTHREKLDAGRLRVFYTHRRSPYDLARISLNTVLWKGPSEPDINSLQLDGLTIHSRKRYLKTAMDGELFRMITPLKVKVIPRGLSVLVPGDAW